MKNSTVYWSTMPNKTFDWSILYNEPTNLFTEKYSQRNKKDRMGRHHGHNMFMCPAVSKMMKDTFVLRWPISTSLSVDENKEISYKSINYVSASSDRVFSLENSIPLSFSLSYIFFSEDPIEMTLTPPYSHYPKHQKYGYIIPGRFMIDSWFRPIVLEFNLWDNVKDFIIEEDEPFAYISFQNKKEESSINLQRFIMTEELEKISMVCSNTPIWGWGESLSKKYSRFKNSKIEKIIMKQIKDGLV